MYCFRQRVLRSHGSAESRFLDFTILEPGDAYAPSARGSHRLGLTNHVVVESAYSGIGVPELLEDLVIF